MSNNHPNLSIGDWIVHKYYGVGKISKVEDKTINGKAVCCFKVDAQNSTYWIPKDWFDNPRIRPIASSTDVLHAMKAFKKPARDVDVNYRVFNLRIKEARTDGSLLSIARIMRDLHARNLHKKLSDREALVLEEFTDRFLSEWSIITNEDKQSLRPQIQDLLQAQP